MHPGIKFEKSRGILLNHFLYAFLIGTIRAPNEWTTVAGFFGFPCYFSQRRTAPHLIEGIAEEIFYHIPKSPDLIGYSFWEFTRYVGEWLSDEQQESFKRYLINKPLITGEE